MKNNPELGSMSSSSYFIGNSIRLGTIPLRTLSNVLLPDPEGPSKSTFSLSLISIFRLSKIFDYHLDILDVNFDF